MADRTPPLTVEELHALVAGGEIDTVVLAFPDMQGRLQGKRFAARFFLDEVLEHGTEGCNYLLAVDTEMNTVDGYEMSSWERGYGDFAMHPDLSTLRRVPWNEGTALLIADLAWNDGSPVVAAPRQILRRQLDRLAELGLTAQVGTELEFIVFKDTYEQAWDAHYRDLTPANQYNIDYSVLGTGRIEPLLRRIRNEMAGRGPDRRVRQGRVQPRPARDRLQVRRGPRHLRPARRLQDRRQGDRLPGGRLAHLHGQVQRARGQLLPHPPLARRRRRHQCHGRPTARAACRRSCGTSSPGSSPRCATSRSSTRPNINSYKRFQPGSFAPTAVAWGYDNRTCALRVVGHGRSMRFENRLPGGDVNPYLAVAGLVAAGLYGIEQKLELPEACAGNAYTAELRARAHHPARGRRALGEQPDRQGRLRRRGGRALPQHGARRAGRLRRRGHRLGAAPLLRTDVRPKLSQLHELAGAQPGDRGGRRHRPGRHRARTSTPPSYGPDRAQAGWAALAPGDRARLLRRFAVVVDEHLEELARLEVREAGHTIGNARWEAGNVRDLLDYAAGGVERLTGRQIPVPGGLDITILEPLGVVGVIAPWNFPMPIAAWGTAPALAAGNAVILKPAETTPLTALRLAELALEAGLPEDLFQVLPGAGPVAGNALVEHPGVAKIVFTGSTAVGKQVLAKGSALLKRVTLELGGKSPNIVFADADIEAAAAAAPMSFLDNSGQDCCARTRILVQRSAYDRFLELLAPADRVRRRRRPGRRADRRWAR